jgi:hypothetical protein
MPFIEITVTIPKQIISVERVRQAIIDAQNSRTVPKLKALFNQTVEGWDSAPNFQSHREDTSNQLGVRVYPAGQDADKWALVNTGARPHTIRARHAPRLRFQRGYRAGTRPRSLRSQAKQRFGDFVTPTVVAHPGFEAREFTQTIADEHADEFDRDMQDAIAGAAHP